MSLTRRQWLLGVASTPLLPVLRAAPVCPAPLGAIVDEAGYYFDPTRWPDLVNSGQLIVDPMGDTELLDRLLLAELRLRSDKLCTDNECSAFAMSRDSSRAELDALA
ncbi:MAG: hypothetical protein JF606_23470 [Burkholderiales bacterium]|nr:hypothetical protein [Burkholderiales bacterium]